MPVASVALRRRTVCCSASSNTDVVRATLRTLEMLKIDDGIEDILITLDTQYHLIRPVSSRSGQGGCQFSVYAINDKALASTPG